MRGSRSQHGRLLEVLGVVLAALGLAVAVFTFAYPYCKAAQATFAGLNADIERAQRQVADADQTLQQLGDVRVRLQRLRNDAGEYAKDMAMVEKVNRHITMAEKAHHDGKPVTSANPLQGRKEWQSVLERHGFNLNDSLTDLVLLYAPESQLAASLPVRTFFVGPEDVTPFIAGLTSWKHGLPRKHANLIERLAYVPDLYSLPSAEIPMKLDQKLADLEQKLRGAINHKSSAVQAMKDLVEKRDLMERSWFCPNSG